MKILDVVGLEIASFGSWSDEGSDKIIKENLDRPSYRKMVFEHGQMVGAIAIGLSNDIWHTNDIGMLKGLIYTKCDLKLKRKPFAPSVDDLHKNGRNFPPNFLHESWMDYLYWDIELEP